MTHDLVTLLEFNGLIVLFCVIYTPIMSWVLSAHS